MTSRAANGLLCFQARRGLLIEGEAQPRELRAGDYLLLPPYQQHRVEWTNAHAPTVWLAVHYGPNLC